MARFLADETGDNHALFLEDAQHMVRTLRLKVGDAMTVLDGAGNQAQGVITDADPKRVSVAVEAWAQVKGEPTIEVTVYQGLCKGPRFETVVQKCTELGVHTIVPLVCHRSEIPITQVAQKLPRYEKIAREATKQCGRGTLVHIVHPMTIAQLCTQQHDRLYVPYEEATQHSLRAALQGCEGVRSIGLVIGPEGGLEAGEVAMLKEAGGEVVTLGPRILRTETAGPAALAVIMALMGQWEGAGA